MMKKKTNIILTFSCRGFSQWEAGITCSSGVSLYRRYVRVGPALHSTFQLSASFSFPADAANKEFPLMCSSSSLPSWWHLSPRVLSLECARTCAVHTLSTETLLRARTWWGVSACGGRDVCECVFMIHLRPPHVCQTQLLISCSAAAHFRGWDADDLF